jgi:hypothetical protein
MRDPALTAGIGIDTSNSLSQGRVEPQRGEGTSGENNARFGQFAPADPSSQARLRPSPGSVKKGCRNQCSAEPEAQSQLHAFTHTANAELYTFHSRTAPPAMTVQNLKETVNLLNSGRFGRFRLFENASPERLEANQAHRLHQDQ